MFLGFDEPKIYGTLSIKEGEKIELTCEVSSNPASTYQWYKDGVSIDVTETTNVFSKMNSVRTDAGNYSCKVSNGTTDKMVGVALKVFCKLIMKLFTKW